MSVSPSKPIVIGLSQINNSFSEQNYLPYSVGLLQAYIEKAAAKPGQYDFLLPLYRRLPVRQAVAHLNRADIVGFSIYVWNVQLSLEIARRLKAENPGCLIVVGGPQVPDKPEEFLRKNRFIDIAVHNEGERVFLDIVQRYPARDWAGLTGISYIDPDGRFVRESNGPRFRDISEFPSPFLDGTFEALIAAHPEETWIALWETNRGCPFQCTFCDWGSATAAKVLQFEFDRLKQEIDWFVDHQIEFIFCCDANFGILPRDVEIARYVAERKKMRGYPSALSVQNTKNATERAYATQKILSDAGLNKGVALSLQSVDSETLSNIKRQNISLETYLELQRRFTKDGVETYSDLILGLPGETYDSFVDGIDMVMESGQHNRIQFNNLSILPNAEMGDPEYQKKFGMVTIESRIINIHGSLETDPDDIYETQQLVIKTNSMAAADWRRTRTYAWTVALLHFDKLLQIPILTLHELCSLRYRHIIDAFVSADASEYPLIAEIRKFFMDFAHQMQLGGPEYVYSADWLGVFWPADEYMFIKLSVENRLGEFYDEAARRMTSLIGEADRDDARAVLGEAIALNRALIKQPFQSGEVTVRCNYDVLDFYRSTLLGEPNLIVKRPMTYRIDRSSEVYEDLQLWCREVVWYGNKKGAYLYGNRVVNAELAGHY